jgi:hypothetical protein
LHLARLFEVLDTPPDRRQKNLDELLAAFPYVNGELFRERLGFADFNRAMRDALVACTNLDWSRISPAIFGSLFQGVMDARERRQTGGHYTSERDILKVINALFMDALRAEYGRIRHSKAMLRQFHAKLGTLRFFDPACGCGNFLVITYRELRLLEIDVLKALVGGDTQQLQLSVHEISRVDVDAFYGIEIQEWPARIAEVAMWLMDHQMNLRLSEAFGQYFVRLPLRKAAHIHNGNALRLDWKAVLPPDQCSYVLGNPPFIGAKFQDDAQRADIASVAVGVPNGGLLDYVTGWYFKAADYIQGSAVCVGFVSTNSISQGEQVGVLWNALFRRDIKIQFAFRTFPWASEARGKAHVHVVIIGFATFDSAAKRLYEDAQGTISASEVSNISPYLIEGGNTVVLNRSTPLCDVPGIGIGNKPIDGGNYLFKPEEKAAFLKLEPEAAPFFRRWIGSDEFINNVERWCLWLGDCPPAQLRQMPHAMKRVEAVRDFRLASKSAPTRKIAATPTRFHVENFPKSKFLVMPKVSSERRNFIPTGFMGTETLVSDLCFILPDATLYHFGILTSTMHMAWMRQVCGRLESRYRYSAGLVYNNFPWPENPDEKQKAAVEAKAQAVLDARAKYPISTLADLYDPLTMPADLVKAHAELDRAVDQCYRRPPFTSERQRVEFLFALYERYSTPLLPEEKKARKSSSRAKKAKP